ncbi:hypothetical protein B0T16DRAFT_418050 [Cercophora newfieldiana]|uniref:Uncharacterized protein n=1 Tax=Cercophora newfieldiana TaxID=92897 RepID=A0AA40CPN0_9PEZI|nr:hypothetical protein B0T16DRAFT_418050 [Cercophora newfieldiana]
MLVPVWPWPLGRGGVLVSGAVASPILCNCQRNTPSGFPSSRRSYTTSEALCNVTWQRVPGIARNSAVEVGPARTKSPDWKPSHSRRMKIYASPYS